MSKSVSELILFTINFLKNPLRNASVVPSSVFASREMINNIDFSSINTIIELGPGTGIFTKEIIRKCNPKTKIILIELEDTYISLLRSKFGERVIVENTSAHLLDEVLIKHKIEKADLIVSGLPFSLPHKVLEKLCKSIKKQTDNGAIYRFFTYMPPIMKLAYTNLPIREVSFVPRNFPPLWVYGIN